MPIPFKPQDRLKLERRPTGINAETRMSGPERALTLGSAALDPMGTIAQMGLERLLGGKEESIFDNLVDNPRTGKQEIAEKQEAFIPHVWKNSSGPKAEKARKLYRKNFGWAPATKDKPADAIIIRRAQEEPVNKMVTSSGRGSVFAEKLGHVESDDFHPRGVKNIDKALSRFADPDSAGYFKANKDSDGSQVGGSNVIISAIRPGNPLLTLPNTSKVIKTHDTGKDALISLAGNKEGLKSVRRHYYDREKKAMPLAARGGYDSIIGNTELMLKEPSPKDPGIRDAVKEQQLNKVKKSAWMEVPHEWETNGIPVPERLEKKIGSDEWPIVKRPDPYLFTTEEERVPVSSITDPLATKAVKKLNIPWGDWEGHRSLDKWIKGVRNKSIIPPETAKIGLRATEPDKWFERALPKTKLDYGPSGVPAEDLKNPEVRKRFIDEWLSK